MLLAIHFDHGLVGKKADNLDMQTLGQR